VLVCLEKCPTKKYVFHDVNYDAGRSNLSFLNVLLFSAFFNKFLKKFQTIPQTLCLQSPDFSIGGRCLCAHNCDDDACLMKDASLCLTFGPCDAAKELPRCIAEGVHISIAGSDLIPDDNGENSAQFSAQFVRAVFTISRKSLIAEGL
jgi:hypothetical protein